MTSTTDRSRAEIESEIARAKADISSVERTLQTITSTLDQAVAGHGVALSEHTKAKQRVALALMSLREASHEAGQLPQALIFDTTPSSEWKFAHGAEAKLLDALSGAEARASDAQLAVTRLQGQRQRFEYWLPGLRGRLTELEDLLQAYEAREAALHTTIKVGEPRGRITVAELRKRVLGG